MKTFAELLGKALTVLLVLVVIGAILAFPVKWLWNWLMPVLFGFPVITTLQALGLTVLANILFKGSSSSSKS